MTYTIDLQLSDLNVASTFNDDHYSQTVESFVGKGKFQVPLLDPSKFALSDVQMSLTTNVGGAVWKEFDHYLVNPRVFWTYDASLAGTSLLQGNSSQNGVDGNSSFGYWAILSHTSLDVSEGQVIDYLTGDPHTYTPGKFTPILFEADVGVAAGVSGASVLAGFRPPVLEVTYTFDPLVDNFTAADLPGGDSSIPAVRTYQPLGQPTIPAGLLPDYVTAPEPSTMLLSLLAIVACAPVIKSARTVRSRSLSTAKT